MTSERKYDEFIASIDVSVAGSDQHGDLKWHIDCTAMANAEALASAEMALDDWQSFLPTTC